MGTFGKIIGSILLCCCAIFANDNLHFADSCYSVRALKANGDKADAKNAKLMINAYRKAMADTSVLEKATTGYIKSLYFSLRFVPFEKKNRMGKLDTLKNESEKAFNKFPTNKEIAHIYAAAMSMWGAEKNPLAAVKDGVALKVRDVAYATKNYQVLGRAHQLLPYIPLILPWPDKDSADKYLGLALQNDPKDLYNYYFLAEFRMDQKRYDEALEIIRQGLARGVRTEEFLEDRRGRWHLKEIEKKINAKTRKK